MLEQGSMRRKEQPRGAVMDCSQPPLSISPVPLKDWGWLEELAMKK